MKTSKKQWELRKVKVKLQVKELWELRKVKVKLQVKLQAQVKVKCKECKECEGKAG